MAVVHVGSRRGADDVVEAGASGLVHLFADEMPDPDFAARLLAARAFVTPTLSVIESTTGVASGAGLIADPRLARFISAQEKTSLEGRFPTRPGAKRDLATAFAVTKQLFAAGVPILAGTDAPNPGTAHGVSLHRELELLVQAGLPASGALAAATSVPARVYGLRDRGRIAPGLRADLLLVAGDPTTDITATRDIVTIWKAGAIVSRTAAAATAAAAAAPATDGTVSQFDGGEVAAAFGSGWQTSTDTMMGGTSTAAMAVVKGGANGTPGALQITGTLAAGRRLSVGRRDVLPGTGADDTRQPLAVQDARVLGPGRRPRAPGHGLRRPPRQHPGNAVVHGRPGVEGGTSCRWRRSRASTGPTCAACYSPPDRRRAPSVRRRRDQAALTGCDALQAAAPVLTSRLDAVRLAGLSLLLPRRTRSCRTSRATG